MEPDNKQEIDAILKRSADEDRMRKTLDSIPDQDPGNITRPRTLEDALTPVNPAVSITIKLSNGAVAVLEDYFPSTILGRMIRDAGYPGWKITESPSPRPTLPGKFPRWKSTEEVEAFRIESIYFIPKYPDDPMCSLKVPRKLRGVSANWTVVVTDHFWETQEPKVGGYYVVLWNGLELFMEREAFESRYHPVTQGDCHGNDGH